MPGPRRTPPAETADPLPGHPYPSTGMPRGADTTPGRNDLIDPGTVPGQDRAAGPRPELGPDTFAGRNAPTLNLRKLEPPNGPPATGPLGSELPGEDTPAPTGQPGPDPAEQQSPPGTDRDAEPGQLYAGNQRAAGRPEPVGVAKAPQARFLLPGLQLQPLVHVDDMAEAIAFYEKLGGEVNHGDRAGEWVLMQVGTAQIGLVTRPPDASRGESTVELNFTATMPLDRLERMLRAQGVTIVEMTADRDLGTQLHVETPEGMPVKIHQVEPELLV